MSQSGVETIRELSRPRVGRVQLRRASIRIPRGRAVTAGEVRVADTVVDIRRGWIRSDVLAKRSDRVIDAALTQKRVAKVVQ